MLFLPINITHYSCFDQVGTGNENSGDHEIHTCILAKQVENSNERKAFRIPKKRHFSV